MTIDHYVECGVCNGKRSYLNNSDTSHHSMSSDRLQPGNNVPRSGSFRERNERRTRVLPIRSGSFREPEELKKEKYQKRPAVHLRSGTNRDSPETDYYGFKASPGQQRRRNSLPLPSSTPNLHKISQEDVQENREREHGVRRVRSFRTTTKGLVNRGDSFRKRGGRVPSTERIRYAYTPSPCPTRRVPLEVQVEKPPDNPANLSYFTIIVLGANGVGKTSITQQFMTSEYVAFDNSIDHEGDNVVTVQLNGEESTLEFLDVYENEVNLEDVRADAYVVVFSIAHRDTFDVASDLLSNLRMDLGTDRSIILVGNKLDLVRKRKVKTEEAQDVATMYDARYLEVSAGLNHNIDELLVGMLALIRYKLDPSLPPPIVRVDNKRQNVSRFSFKGPLDFFSRLFQLARDKLKPGRKH